MKIKFFRAGLLFLNFFQFFFLHSSFAIVFFSESIYNLYAQEVIYFLAEQTYLTFYLKNINSEIEQGVD